MNWFQARKQSNRKRNPEGHGRRKLSIEPLEDRRLLAILQAFDLQVHLDEFGSFGAEMRGADVNFDILGNFANDPADAFFRKPNTGEGRTTKESGVAINVDIDGDGTPENDPGAFLSTGCIDGPSDRFASPPYGFPLPVPCTFNLPQSPFSRDGQLFQWDPQTRLVTDPDAPLTRVFSTFDFDGDPTVVGDEHPFLNGLSFAVVQELQPLPDTADGSPGNFTGALLVQRYTITNTSAANKTFDFRRYLDDDLIFAAADQDDGLWYRRALGDIEWLIHRDADTRAYVGHALLGGVDVPDESFEIAEVDFLINKIRNGVPLDETVAGVVVDPDDPDVNLVEDIFTDGSSAWSTRIVSLEPGDSVDLTVLTAWGLLGDADGIEVPNTPDELQPSPRFPTIGGLKFFDNDKDGIQDPGETGLAGWSIELHREEPQFSGNFNLVATQQTFADGTYNFGPVLPGTYIVRESFDPRFTGDPVGFVQTAPRLNPNNPGMVIPDPPLPLLDTLPPVDPLGVISPVGTNAYQFEAAPNDVLNFVFGNIRPSISGVKFHDLNADGRRSRSEDLLNNWQIELWEDDGDGVFEPYISVASGGDGQVPKDVQLTGASGTLGRYEFNNSVNPNLLIGGRTYFIQETPIVDAPGIPGQPLQSDRWIQTRPSKSFFTVVFQDGDVIDGLDFGNIRIAGLTGVKFLDINENGKQDRNEPGLAGVKIFVDRDNNGLHNPSGNEEFAITGPDGRWTIPFVVPGPGLFTIAEELPKPRDLWIQTFPGPESDFVHKVSLLGGATVENIDFGNKAFARITGEVFYDENNNNQKTPGERGLGDVYVWIDQDGNGRPNVGEPGAFSNPDGSYDISPVDPLGGMNVTVRSTPRIGWAATFPTPDAVYNIRIEPGRVVNDNDFGNFPSRDMSNPGPYVSASHGVVPNVHLGGANSMDDGVAFQLVDGMGRGVVTHGGTEFIDVTFGAAQPIVGAKLSAWVDSDLNLTFDDDEQVITDVIFVPAGGTQFGIPITLPPEALPAGVNTTQVRFRLSFQKGLGPGGHTGAGEVEEYEVRIRRPGENVAAVDNAVDLGPVGDVTLMDESIDGMTTYLATAELTGLFSVTAAFDQADGDVAFVVYDRSSGTEIASSGAYDKGAKVVTFDAKKDQQYEIRITGNHPGVDLRLQNMVMVNSPATVVGTDGDDVIRFVAGKSKHVLTVNGVDYEFDAATNEDFIVLGKDGTDSITIVGDDRNDRARFKPNELRLDAATYDLLARDVENVDLDAGGGKNRLTVYDSPGDDVLEAGPAGPNNVKFSGDGFSITASEIDKLNAISGAGGVDRATFTDTDGNDKLTSKPIKTVFKGANLNNTTLRFAVVDVLAGAGNDSAVFYDSRQVDTIAAAPGDFNISGAGYSNSAHGMKLIVVKSKAGDRDVATLTDSTGKDRLAVWPHRTRFMGPGFRYDLFGIEEVAAESTHGGDDVAKFFGSAGDEKLVAAPNDIFFSGSDFSGAAKGFARNLVFSHQGGNDIAEVSGGPGNDVYSGRKSIFELTGAGSFLYGRGFDEVDLDGKGGQDSLEGDLALLDQVFGDWN